MAETKPDVYRRYCQLLYAIHLITSDGWTNRNYMYVLKNIMREHSKEADWGDILGSVDMVQLIVKNPQGCPVTEWAEKLAGVAQLRAQIASLRDKLTLCEQSNHNLVGKIQRLEKEA